VPVMGIRTSQIKFQTDDGKRAEVDLITILLIFLAIGIIVGAILFIFYFRESKIAELIEEKTTLTALVVENDGERTETVLLGFYDPGTKKGAFIALPDITRLRVDYEDKPAYDIVRNIYSKGGIGVLRKTVEKLTGEHFDYYLVYDVKDAERFVDLLEGIEVDNPVNLNYSDVDKGVFIRVRKGFELLDGAKTKQLLRYQYGEQAQQTVVDIRRALVESALRRIGDIEALFGNRKVYRRLLRQVKSNLGKKDISVLVKEARGVNATQLLFFKTFGKNVTVNEEVYMTPVENGKWLKGRIEEVKKYLKDEGPVPIKDEINIEILNGSNNPGQALSLRNYLLEYGLNIVHYGNALRSDYEKSQVIDRTGEPALARKVADIINCTEITTKVDKTLMVDVSIIIGNDFEGQFVR
jgi:LCP family protein required for cell wall assembly